MVADAVIYREGMWEKSGSKWNSLVKMNDEWNESLEYMEDFIASAKSEIRKMEISTPAAITHKSRRMFSKTYSWNVEVTEGSSISSVHVEPQYEEKFSGQMRFYMSWDSPVEPLVEFNPHNDKFESRILPRSVWREEEGWVIVRVLISPDGEISNAKLHSSAASARFNQLAIDITRKTFINPNKKLAAPLQLDVKFSFSIRDCNGIVTC